MTVGSSGVSGLFWKTPIIAGNVAIWSEAGVLADGGAPPSTGTVTSVGLALPVSVFTISGSPVTTSGTLTGSFATQSANTVFAGPGSGVAAVPSFRALVSADLPSTIVAGGPIGSSSVIPVITWNAQGQLTAVSSASISVPVGANPTATIGTAAVNGVATTFMRSDAAPAFGNLTGDVTSIGMVSTLATTQPGAHTWQAQNDFSTVTIGGAAIGANALAIAGQVTTNGSLIIGASFTAGGGNQIGFSSRGIFTSPGSGIIQVGAANAASPVAQTLQAQGSRAGTDSNVGGANLTERPGLGTGTGTGSSLVWQAPALAASGTGAQTYTEVARIQGGATPALKWTANNSTGAGSALLGTNSPASTLTAPYTWVQVLAGDGSVCYMPIWK